MKKRHFNVDLSLSLLLCKFIWKTIISLPREHYLNEVFRGCKIILLEKGRKHITWSFPGYFVLRGWKLSVVCTYFTACLNKTTVVCERISEHLIVDWILAYNIRIVNKSIISWVPWVLPNFFRKLNWNLRMFFRRKYPRMSY